MELVVLSYIGALALVIIQFLDGLRAPQAYHTLRHRQAAWLAAGNPPTITVPAPYGLAA
jgi:hypothetical protein